MSSPASRQGDTRLPSQPLSRWLENTTTHHSWCGSGSRMGNLCVLQAKPGLSHLESSAASTRLSFWDSIQALPDLLCACLKLTAQITLQRRRGEEVYLYLSHSNVQHCHKANSFLFLLLCITPVQMYGPKLWSSRAWDWAL